MIHVDGDFGPDCATVAALQGAGGFSADHAPAAPQADDGAGGHPAAPEAAP